MTFKYKRLYFNNIQANKKSHGKKWGKMEQENSKKEERFAKEMLCNYHKQKHTNI